MYTSEFWVNFTLWWRIQSSDTTWISLFNQSLLKFLEYRKNRTFISITKYLRPSSEVFRSFWWDFWSVHRLLRLPRHLQKVRFDSVSFYQKTVLMQIKFLTRLIKRLFRHLSIWLENTILTENKFESLSAHTKVVIK